MLEWKDVVGFEGSYKVSNTGLVKSMSRWTGYYTVTEKMLKQRTSNGYKYVSLTKNSKTITKTVHSIVARAFIGERPKNLVIDHEDDNKLNNNSYNLKYVTNRMNVAGKSTAKRGAYKQKNGKWRAQIKINKKTKLIGYFNTSDEAYQSYFNKYVEIHGIKPWVED